MTKRSRMPNTHKVGKPRRLALMGIMMNDREQRLLVNREGCYNLKDTDIKAMLKKKHVKLIRVKSHSFCCENRQLSYIKLTRKGRVYYRANTE